MDKKRIVWEAEEDARDAAEGLESWRICLSKLQLSTHASACWDGASIIFLQIIIGLHAGHMLWNRKCAFGTVA